MLVSQSQLIFPGVVFLTTSNWWQKFTGSPRVFVRFSLVKPGFPKPVTLRTVGPSRIGRSMTCARKTAFKASEDISGPRLRFSSAQPRRKTCVFSIEKCGDWSIVNLGMEWGFQDSLEFWDNPRWFFGFSQKVLAKLENSLSCRQLNGTNATMKVPRIVLKKEKNDRFPNWGSCFLLFLLDDFPS